MYKLFSFLFFLCISFFIILFLTLFLTKKEFPYVPFLIVNFIIYFAFILYIFITSFLKAKNSFHETKIVKFLKSKLTKDKKFSAFVNFLFTLIYILLIFITTIFIFVVFVFSAFRTNFAKLFTKPEQVITRTADREYLDSEFKKLEKSISDLGFQHFLTINNLIYTDSDHLYDYKFEITNTVVKGSFFEIVYKFRYSEKEEPISIFYEATTDKMKITGKIKLFDAKSYFFPLFKYFPVFVVKVVDSNDTHFRLFFAQNSEDISSMYEVVDPKDVIGENKIKEITVDPSKSTFTIYYQAISGHNFYDVIEFKKEKDGNIILKRVLFRIPVKTLEF